MMDLNELLPAGILQELRHLDSYVSTQRRQSLPELLRAWSRYANRLSNQEAVDLDDYMPMLFARDAIQDVIQQATLTVARLLEALIAHDDSIFLFCSQQDRDNVLATVVTSIPPHWWWHRIPLLISSS
jgi:hypothetical protein